VKKQPATRAREDLKTWLERGGLPHHSPHKFRHGHAVYALKQSADVDDLKAVSLTLMHANLSVTDGVYGVLSQADVQEHIAALGKKKGEAKGASPDEIIPLLEQLLERLRAAETPRQL
jgi:site-specific recombinase XerD